MLDLAGGPSPSTMMRDRITQALMNIQNPPPATTMPGANGGPTGLAAHGGMVAPAAGTQPASTTDPYGYGGVPRTGMPGTMGGGMPGSLPGSMPGSMNPMSQAQNTMQPGATLPGGPQFAPPPMVGQQPQPQTPQMVQPPALGQQQLY